MIVAAVISDRSDLYLPGCIDSLRYNLPVGAGWPPHIIDDSEHHLGMAGAVQAAWQWALEKNADYLLHIEEDFRFNDVVPLQQMARILSKNPHLAQLVLKRQAWSPEEIAAGGIVELHPDDYEDHLERVGAGTRWTEHDRIFSLNPCLIPRRVLELGWSDDNEAGFTKTCLAEGYRFAFWGSKFAPPTVTHVGRVRGKGWRL